MNDSSAATTDCPACDDSTCTHREGCILDEAFDKADARSAATTEPRTLEELVEAGEVEAALLLKGAYTKREMDLVRDAWAAGIKMGKEIERSRRAHGLT